MSDTNKTIELWRFCQESIKVNGIFCHGFLSGKYFLIQLETPNEVAINIKWHKRSQLEPTPLVTGIRAEKLINLVLSHIEENDTTRSIINQLQIIRAKNQNFSIYSRVGCCNPQEADSIRQRLAEERRRKARKEVERIKQDALTKSEQGQNTKQAKEERRQARIAQQQAEKEAKRLAHEERMRQEQEEAQKRIRKQRSLKLLQSEERLYTQMVLSDETKQNPVIFNIENATVILGHLDGQFYRIKIDEEKPSFLIIRDNAVHPMNIEELQSVLQCIDNQNTQDQYDDLLNMFVSAYAQFINGNHETPHNPLCEKVAIAKNMLIQQHVLTSQNVLLG
ncbi:MAG: hypothetical protein IJY58_03510 [Alphaproteobacteria bacterium]|nr:hypothetical protein [Alphaproteobacteria bacterium]